MPDHVVNPDGVIVAKKNFEAPELQLEEDKMRGMGLVKFTTSYIYKLRMVLKEINDKKYGRIITISVCLCCILFITLVVSMFIFSRDVNNKYYSRLEINQKIMDDTKMFVDTLNTRPDTTRFKRFLQSWEKPISYYWGSTIYGDSVL